MGLKEDVYPWGYIGTTGLEDYWRTSHLCYTINVDAYVNDHWLEWEMYWSEMWPVTSDHWVSLLITLPAFTFKHLADLSPGTSQHCSTSHHTIIVSTDCSDYSGARSLRQNFLSTATLWSNTTELGWGGNTVVLSLCVSVEIFEGLSGEVNCQTLHFHPKFCFDARKFK